MCALNTSPKRFGLLFCFWLPLNLATPAEAAIFSGGVYWVLHAVGAEVGKVSKIAEEQGREK